MQKGEGLQAIYDYQSQERSGINWMAITLPESKRVVRTTELPIEFPNLSWGDSSPPKATARGRLVDPKAFFEERGVAFKEWKDHFSAGNYAYTNYWSQGRLKYYIFLEGTWVHSIHSDAKPEWEILEYKDDRLSGIYVYDRTWQMLELRPAGSDLPPDRNATWRAFLKSKERELFGALTLMLILSPAAVALYIRDRKRAARAKEADELRESKDLEIAGLNIDAREYKRQIDRLEKERAAAAEKADRIRKEFQRMLARIEESLDGHQYDNALQFVNDLSTQYPQEEAALNQAKLRIIELEKHHTDPIRQMFVDGVRGFDREDDDDE